MSEDPSVTFIWKIENFFFGALDKGKSLNSPAFYVETLSRSEWYLGIYPNDDEIKVFLHNMYYNDSNFFIDYNISYLYKDGSVLWTAADVKDIQINTDTSYGIAVYPTKTDLFGNQDKVFTFQDTLTVRCQIWQSRKVLKHSLQYISRTLIGIERRIFYWEVPEFSELELNGEKRTRRIIIGSYKPTFSLELSLTGANDNQAGLSIDIKQLNGNISSLFSSVEISILNSKGDTLIKNLDYNTFTPNNSILNFDWCLTKDEITKKRHEYLDGDTLNLRFAIAFNTGENYSNIESVTSFPPWLQTSIANDVGISLNDVPDPDSDISLNDVVEIDSDISLNDVHDPDSDISLNDVHDPDSDISLNAVHDSDSDISLNDMQDADNEESSEESSVNLQDSFLHLYKDRNSSDLQLRSESVSFPVHKSVLAARSSVFNAIFACHADFNDMKVGADNFMDIPDVNPDTLGMLLKFIYTGDVENMDLSSASDLYCVAHKYDVDSLKRKCYDFLYGSDSLE